MRNFNITPVEAVAIYHRREEHEMLMAVLVASSYVICMEAAMEDTGCLPITRSSN